MANYVSIETQYTPLDIDHLQSELKGKRGPTILLIIGIVAFLGSLTYAVTGIKVQSETKAEVKKSPLQISAVPLALNPVPDIVKEFPTTYGDTKIPESLYTDIKTVYAIDTPGRKNYVLDKVLRFYVYREVLGEENLSFVQSEQEGEFAKLIEEVTAMELIIKENLIGTDKKYESLDKLVVERLSNFK